MIKFQKIHSGPLFWVLAIVAFLAVSFFVGIYTDWLWFLEIGFESIFLTSIKFQFFVGGLFGLAVFLLLYLNIALFHFLNKGESIDITVNRGQQVESVDISGIIKKVALPVSLFFGVIFGFFASSAWKEVLVYFNQEAFGILDPVFSKDISFYVFSLPVIELIFGMLFSILFLSFIISFFLYLIKGALVFKNRNSLNIGSLGSNLVEISREAKIHLFSLISVWFLLSALKIYLVKMPNLLYSDKGLIFGASFVDINAYLPALYALIGVSLLGAVLTLLSIKRNNIKLVVISFIGYFAVSFLGLSVYPSLVQSFSVKPNELAKETPYIKNHIKATQDAWGIADVKKRNLPGDSSLTTKDIRENEATIDNIRLWDRGPLLDTFGQLQEIRTYYDFVSADNDRYVIDGDYRQVLLSPRELNSDSLPQKNFINERLTFTHSMGVALSPVNEKTEEGLPVLFVKDLPPISEQEELSVKRPEMYFGELSNEYVIVNTKSKEFDYPSGEENVYSSYEGSGGVEVSSFFKKAIFSVKFKSLKILLSDDITVKSRILYNRDIQTRAKKALPFLDFDNDPYIVIDDGKLVWIYDAYTTSDKYPYSLKVAGKNYMRNSVKVVIDTYDGKIDAYISDENDPIIKAYSGIFPKIFKPINDMPENLRLHIRYPEDIFSYQSMLYSIYHMEEPQVFYNKEDLWEIPKIKGSTRGENIGPIMRHLIMKLPEEKEAEFILMLPFTPKGKNNMAAWMAARSDGENYGELVVYSFPKQSLVFGPEQIVNRINQDTEISRQISLWDQRGSEVIQGNISVIPINESILYIRPLYLRAEGGKIPELKRVIVAYKNQIEMEETLDLALSNIFSGLEKKPGTKTQAATTSSSGVTLIKKANNHYNAAQSALRQGNWTLYGDQMKKLGEVLRLIK